MAMDFEELDAETREHMLAAFEEEEAANPYRSRILSQSGLEAFPDQMHAAITFGNEVSLAAALNQDELWLARDAGGKSVNVQQRSQQLALAEFNTWYVAGLARKLKAEGETDCQVYRAANPKWERSTCSMHEGQTYPIDEILAGHRIAYWPPPGDAGKLSIPAGPGCHHTIRRISR